MVSGSTEQKLFGTTLPGEGMGTWLCRYYPLQSQNDNDAITLTVDTSNVVAAKYDADIIWILSDAP